MTERTFMVLEQSSLTAAALVVGLFLGAVLHAVLRRS